MLQGKTHMSKQQLRLWCVCRASSDAKNPAANGDETACDERECSGTEVVPDTEPGSCGADYTFPSVTTATSLPDNTAASLTKPPVSGPVCNARSKQLSASEDPSSGEAVCVLKSHVYRG